MISFKEFSKKLPVLSWSNPEKNTETGLPNIQWPGHEFIRPESDETNTIPVDRERSNKLRHEASIDESWDWGHPMSYLDHNGHEDYDRDFHDPIKPKGLTDAHKKAIWDYTSTPSKDKDHGDGSSRNINGLHGSEAGDASAKVMHHDPENVRKKSAILSSVFTKENTNGTKVVGWSGIPKNTGRELHALYKNGNSGKGRRFVLPRYTSLTSNKQVAFNFAKSYSKPTAKEHHVIEFHAHPGTIVSTIGNTRYSEDEAIANRNCIGEHRGVILHKLANGHTLHRHIVYLHPPGTKFDD